MTKSKGIGRGGARPGAGRKKKKTAGPISWPAPSGLSAQQLAKQDIDLAISVLADICINGRSEIQRVRAAKVILAHAEPKSRRQSGRTHGPHDRRRR